MWELSVNKVHHADMVEDLLEALVTQLGNTDLQVGNTGLPRNNRNISCKNKQRREICKL